MTTPSEAVRVAVQECWRFALRLANPVASVHASRETDIQRSLDALGEALDRLAVLSLHAPAQGTDALTFERWWDEWCERQRSTLTEYDFKVAEAAWIASRAAGPSLSLHVGDAADTDTGASASPTALCGLRPEPQSGSALRAPIPGAERAAFEAFFEKRWPEFSYSRQSAWECWQGGATWGIARGIDSGEAGETRSGSTPKGQEPGAREGTRPEESRAQPSLHIEPAPGHRWIQATMEEWDEVQRIRDAATTPPEGPALLTDEQILEIAHDAGLRWPDDEPTGAQDDITIAIGRAIESKVRARTLTDPEGAS